MATYRITMFHSPSYDSDGFCTDAGAEGATLATIEAAYPGAIRRADVEGTLRQLGVATRGLAVFPAVAGLAWRTVDGVVAVVI